MKGPAACCCCCCCCSCGGGGGCGCTAPLLHTVCMLPGCTWPAAGKASTNLMVWLMVGGCTFQLGAAARETAALRARLLPRGSIRLWSRSSSCQIISSSGEISAGLARLADASSSLRFAALAAGACSTAACQWWHGGGTVGWQCGCMQPGLHRGVVLGLWCSDAMLGLPQPVVWECRSMSQCIKHISSPLTWHGMVWHGMAWHVIEWSPAVMSRACC